MTYRSPFDTLERRGISFGSGNGDSLFYNGTLDQLLSQTSKVVTTEPLERTMETELQRALHPPRIIRALLDYKISNSSQRVEDLISAAIQLGLQTYIGRETAPLISQLPEKITERDERMLDAKVYQKDDGTTWQASKPDYSQKTSTALANQTQKDLLFIALAHGGVAAGMDVYLRYCDQVQSKNSFFYTVRYSKDKANDCIPQISIEEKRMLQRESPKKDIVIFDEDSCSGDTLYFAREFFRDILKRKKIKVITNDISQKAKLKLGLS